MDKIPTRDEYENRLMAENGEKLEEEVKALTATKKQVKKYALRDCNKQQFKVTCRNSGKYDHNTMYCPEKRSEEKTNDTNIKTKCCFSDKCFYCRKVSHVINECCNKKAVEEEAKVAIYEEKEQENEQVELTFDSTSQIDNDCVRTM